MAPADTMAPPGSSSYSSDTMSVGDGTWDFTKNTFLLPNLVGMNFDTMRYNGMGNRFATIPQYHRIILAHGVLGAIAFLFIIPAAVMFVRFHRGPQEVARRYHAYLNVLAVGLTTVVFILGWFAVGPNRSLTNPHHGIGVAIYVLILLQAIGGRLVKHIRHRSLRLTVHHWSGRAIAILGIVQVPLGLTLYGSPKFCFVLYALWMSFLVLLYFIYSYKRDGHQREYLAGRRSEVSRSERRSSGGGMKWLGPLAAGAGAWALLRGRGKDRDRDRSRSRSRHRSRSRVRSRSRGPEVIPSRRGSGSYIEDEKYSERRPAGGGIMNKVLGAGAALGAGALLGKFMGRRDRNTRDEEYSAVATDTPSRPSRLSRPFRRHDPVVTELSDETEYTRHGGRDGRRTPLLPGPGNPVLAAEAMSAAAPRPGTAARPMTPRPSHRRGDSRVDSLDDSDYSSYQSPSRRTPVKGSGGVGKGLLAGLGLGWFAKKMADRRGKKDIDRMEEEERRTGAHGSRYTGDGYPSPTRRDSRRPGRPPLSARTTTASDMSSSIIETRPPAASGPPMPPFAAPMGGPAPPTVIPVPGGHSRSQSRSRHDFIEPVEMPAMPQDPHGILYPESGSEAYNSSGGRPHRRHSSRRRREGEAAAAAAVASASRLAAEEGRRGGVPPGYPPSGKPVSVKVKVHDDRDRNVTLRRLTEEEQAASRREQRSRRRDDSASSLSGTDTPSRRRYRRDSSQRRAESAAEHAVEEPLAPLSPPNPAFAAGRRPKDSAYYSGQPGPSGSNPAAGHTVSTLDSGSHGTWSGVSPSPSGPLREPTASAADRRRRRRLERRDGSGRQAGTVEFD
ncbi:uncharacterized protein E0L32_007253 [Thyridium curvatum]|uniref:Cytochrome b561 domain-containing protein n=1 Tax=Thyridium curvatum TaxID=1093900 RepID=A0A507B5L1_9PEZI|nr:uncharacterized protein E0L32_007253 [Thyridium curvatum]TPX12138.1 hypothetical protein E0L32_007253 [Thyridium curvatum]